MSANDDDIRVRIAGDLADINKALQELRRQTRASGKDARAANQDWNVLGTGLDKLQTRVKQLAAAYVSFRTAQSLLRAVIQNTTEAERVAAQLEARVRSTGQVAGFTAEQLLGIAQELQRTTAYGDEAVASMQTLLLSFTNIRGDTFVQATEAILDMATALGQDLETAAQRVGRALNDPVRGMQALQGAGINLTSAQRALVRQLVETNQVAAAQGIILDELRKKFGGAAAADRNTLRGAIEAVKNAFGDLFEVDGGGVSAITESLNRLVDVLSDPATIEAFQTLAAAVLTLATEITQAVTRVVTNLSLAVQDSKAILSGSELDNLLRRIRGLRTEIELLEAAERAGALGGNRVQLERARQLLAELEAQREALTAEAPPTGEEPRALEVTPEPVVIQVDPREAIKQLQASLAAARVLLDDEIKRVGAALDRDFERNLVRFSEYFQRRADLERQTLDNELEQRRAALQLLDAEIRLAEERGDETEQQENNRRRLVAEITALERQRGDIAVNAANRQADAERQLARQLEQVRQRLLELQGDTVGARQLALQTEFRELLERLAIEGDQAGTELVQNLINIELARTRLSELEAEYERTLAELARQERRVAIQVETGVISEREGRRRIIELHRQTAAEVEQLIPLMRELAEATGDPAAIERLKEMELELEELGKTAKVAAREMATTLRDAGEEAFSSFLDGTRSAKDAFQDFIDDIRRKVADLVAERLFDRMFQVLSRGGTGGQGGGLFASILGGLFHRGGVVGLGAPAIRVPALAFAGAPRLHNGGIAGLGPNEIPAVLEAGEEVLTRSDPRHRFNRGGGDTININLNAPDAPRRFRENRRQLEADAAALIIRARNRNGG